MDKKPTKQELIDKIRKENPDMSDEKVNEVMKSLDDMENGKFTITD